MVPEQALEAWRRLWFRLAEVAAHYHKEAHAASKSDPLVMWTELQWCRDGRCQETYDLLKEFFHV